MATLLCHLEDLKKSEEVQSLYRELIKHKNYAKETWKTKQPQIFDEVQSLSEILGMSWEEAKKDIQEYFSNSLNTEYEKFKQNPNEESFLAFKTTLYHHKKLTPKACESFPKFLSYARSYLDSECVNDEERLFLLKREERYLKKCPYCNQPIHLTSLRWQETCGRRECLAKLKSEKHLNFSEEKKRDIRKRTEETCLKKYGVKASVQSDLVREKAKSTCREKYGVDFATQAETVKKKKEETLLERYGVTSPAKNALIREKMRATCLKKYGVPNFKQSSRCGDLFLKKYGVENRNLIGKDPEKVKILKSRELFKEYLENHPSLTLEEIGEDLGFSAYFVGHTIHNYEFEDMIGLKTSTSSKEHSLLEYVKSLLPKDEVVSHDRTTIYPYELDISIPSKKIAIEFNGNFWHSDYHSTSKESQNAKTRHLFKTKLCRERGIRLIHVFEYEWDLNTQKIKDFLKDALRERSTLYARKCEVKEIRSAETKDFLKENHLQGYAPAKVTFGLFYEGELVACMSFSTPRFSKKKKYDWEIIRFASRKGLRIQGAAGKLLHAFREKYSGSIISYADASKMTGDVYRALGMHEEKTSSPGYVWVKSNEILPRYRTQKAQLLKEGYSGRTESEIMESRGFFRVYDCGNYVFTLV